MTAEEALELFEQAARPWLDMCFARNTCMEQSRVLVEVLKRFGIAAEPLATKLHVVCAAREFQFFSSGDPADHEKARRLPKGYRRNPSDRPDDEWGYHTVALVERRILADMTFAQAESEEFDFRLKPQMVTVPFPSPVPPGELPDVYVSGESTNGVPFTVRWMGVADRDWEDKPAWEPSHLWKLIDDIGLAMWNEWLERRKAE